MSMIDIKEVRSRIQYRQQRSGGEVADWRKVLTAGTGNSRLLGLIIAHKPASVGELTTLAGRLQPNVSRSLAALVRAGLVELRQNKRASVPVATSLGVEKAAAMGIATADAPAAEAGVLQDRYVSVVIEETSEPTDHVFGRLDVRIPFKDCETAYGHRADDLTRLAERWSSDWWRMLYRREAYQLCDLSVLEAGPYEASLSVQRRADRIDVLVRKLSEEGEPSRPRRFAIAVEAFESALRDGVFTPVASELARRGEADRPLHSNIAHLKEISGDANDLAYWRTAGALGLRLRDDVGDVVKKLFDDIPDEDARLEFASAVLPESAAGAIAWIEKQISDHGLSNRLTNLGNLARECGVQQASTLMKPYRRGIALAKRVRELLNLRAEDPIGGLSGLANALGAPGFTSGTSTASAGEVRGFRSDELGGPAVVIDGSHGAESAMFLLARGVGDYIAFGAGRAPITDVYTERQQIGRAFAAELIAPSEAVVAMINDGQPRLRVANHFGAMPIMIGHQYGNNAAGRG